jgi:hypothetical protein
MSPGDFWIVFAALAFCGALYHLCSVGLAILELWSER